MSSIRKRLVLWLLLGLAVLWATAGAGVYFAVRNGELARLDARLDTLSNGVRFYGNMIVRDRIREQARAEGELPAELERRDRAPDGAERRDRPPEGSERRSPNSPDRRPPFFQEGSNEYFSMIIRARTGEFGQSSPSLGEESLSIPEIEGGEEPQRFDTRLLDGTPVRAMAFRFRAGFGRGRPRSSDRSNDRPSPPIDAVVAVDASPMRATLTNLVLGIAGVGALAALASVGLVHLALRDGLKPLRELGDQLGEVDAQSLGDGRFSADGKPTELTPVYDRLGELMGRLGKSFERERRFSADLAHELRTPIAELRTMAEVALKWPDGSDNAEQSQQTLEIAEQMGGIIESLLALGRFENGQEEIVVEAVDLNELLTTSWKPFTEAAAQKNLNVEIDIDPGSTIETDPKLLRVIVANLLSNAAEYTPESGSINIDARPGEIVVSNDAPSLDSEKVTHLFERFWRADGSRTDGSHSGLGLSLARACARVLGLELAASYEDGRVNLALREKTSEKDPGVISG